MKLNEAGSISTAATYTPMTVVSNTLQKRWNTDPSCFATDDQYSWKVTGSLLPGESYTFTAKPTCDWAELPVIAVRASWDASDIEVTSVAPANDGISDDFTQVGTPITAAARGREAHLCMFTTASGKGYSWSVTVRNRGTETAWAVTLEGEQHNGWYIFFHNQCARADADGDGWNDSIEHGLQLMSYYTPYPDPSRRWAELDGSNYLRRSSATATATDEVDAYPPDVNDDGLVNEADAAVVTSFLGQGTGVSLDRIDANPGPNDMYQQAGIWRRYDLDGSGRVTAHDLDLVRALIGKPLPMSADILAPTVEVRAPAGGAAVARGSDVLVEAFASDERWITKVDFYADGSFVCSAAGGEITLAQRHQFSCWWKTPRKAGPVALTARTSDAAGNAAQHSITVNVQ